MEVGLLTGGGDKPYACGMAAALMSKGVRVEFVGSDEVDCPELHDKSEVVFLNLRGSQTETASVAAKAVRVLRYYVRLIRYASAARPRVFHILWNNKVELFDRTLLMVYYKLMGKKIAFTVHNVNAGRRDGNDSRVNRLTLRVQYGLADHMFVHTKKMRSELMEEFGVPERAVSVIPFGINESVPNTDLTPGDAKQKLGIGQDERTILFFGNIAPYKGLEFLLLAFRQVVAKAPYYRLIVAGKARQGCEKYMDELQQLMDANDIRSRIIQRIEYIPDEEVELYFKAGDVLVLPYRQICQSGVLFLAYSFGLPVIATDVGSMREDVVEGSTGFVCKPCDGAELAAAIDRYFGSELFNRLGDKRKNIREYARRRNSWDVVGEMTRDVYAQLLGTGG